MARVLTDLNTVQYKGSKCTEIYIDADDIGSAAQSAQVTFTFDSTFINIADGLTFTIFNQEFTTGTDDGMVDLSSSSIEENTQSFAEFLYSRFQFNGLFSPPSSYGDNLYTYDTATNTGEIIITWLEAGLINPFDFEIGNLSSNPSSINIFEGADFNGKENYRVLYRLYDGITPVSKVFSMPIIKAKWQPYGVLPPIDLMPIINANMGTMSLDNNNYGVTYILNQTNPTKDELMYKEFFLRVGSKWTEGDSCTVKFSDFNKSLPIRVHRSSDTGFITEQSITYLCRGLNLLLWAYGKSTHYKISYKFKGFNLQSSVTRTLDFSEKECYAIPLGSNIFINDNPLSFEDIEYATVRLFDGTNLIDTHVIMISNCDCCTPFYYELIGGGWAFSCLKPIKETDIINRVDDCLFGCGESMSSRVTKGEKVIEYETSHPKELLSIAYSPKILYLNNDDQLIPVRVKAGSFEKGSTKITITE